METEYKQGQSFTDTRGNTGIVNFDTKTGNRLSSGQSTFISTPTTGSITADTLVNPPKPLVVPPIQPPTYGGLEGTLAGTVATNKQNQATADQLKIEEAKKTSDTSLNSLLGAITESGTISSSVDRTEQDAAKKRSDFYTSQIEQEDLALRRQIESLDRNKQGFFGGGVEIEKNRLTRESLSKQADLAILQTAANRDFDTAAAIADRKVAMKMEASKAKIDALTLFYQDNKEQFTKLEQRQFESKLKEEQRAYEKEYKKEEQNNAMLLNAIQGNAPTSVIAKAQQLVNSGASTNEVAAALGKYSVSLADRLDTQLKQAQLNKANTPSGGEAPTIKSINGVDMQWNGKEWVKPTTGATDSTDLTSRTSKDLNTIETLGNLIDGKGQKGAVGVAGISRNKAARFVTGGLAGKGAKNNYVASVEQLTKELTLSNLINAKAQGATFGALSIPELTLLSDSATKINNWARDKDGNPPGSPKFQGAAYYEIDENSFNKELATIKKYAELDFIAKNGMTPEEYKINTYLSNVDQSLQETNNAYTQAGY